MHVRTPIAARPVRIVAFAAALLVPLLVLAAPPAHAGPLVASAPDCDSQQLETPFTRWGDVASYTLAPNGVAENRADWALQDGADVEPGNESFYIHNQRDRASLALPTGSSDSSHLSDRLRRSEPRTTCRAWSPERPREASAGGCRTRAVRRTSWLCVRERSTCRTRHWSRNRHCACRRPARPVPDARPIVRVGPRSPAVRSPRTRREVRFCRRTIPGNRNVGRERRSAARWTARSSGCARRSGTGSEHPRVCARRSCDLAPR